MERERAGVAEKEKVEKGVETQEETLCVVPTEREALEDLSKDFPGDFA